MLTGPRTLFVHEGLKPAVSFKPPPSAGHRGRRGGTSPGAPVVLVNGKGKAKDGRESLLYKAVFAAVCDLRRMGISCTADNIAPRAWVTFTDKADLSDGKWTYEECYRRAVRAAERYAKGELPLPAETSGLEPYWRPDPKPPDGVRQMLHDSARMFFDTMEGTNGVVVIRQPPGLGKTTTTILIARPVAASGKPIAFFVPTLALAEEVAEKFGLDVARVQRGRGSEDPDAPGQTMCRRAEDADAVARAGVNVREDFCPSCPFYAECAYLAQDAKPHRVVVMAHAYLTVQPPQTWPRFAFVIIDEAFYSQVVDVAEVPLDDLLECCPPPFLAAALLSGLREGRLLAVLRERLGPLAADILRSAAEIARAREKLPRVDGQTPPAKLGAELARARSTARLVSFFRWLARELEAVPGREGSHLARLAGDGNMLKVSLPKSLSWLDETPILVLDAQADPNILDRVFHDRPLTFTALDAERNVDVVQVTSSAFSKTRLLGNADLVRQVVGFAAGLEGRTLVVCPRPVRCSITGEPETGRLPVSTPLSNGVAVAHYGNIRGTNLFEEYHNIVLLGRVQPPPDGVEAQSGLFWRDPEPLVLGQGYVRQDRGYCHPSGRGVSVWVHPDPRMQALVEQSREWEMVQALDRLRLFNPDPARRGAVFIFSNLPLPLPVTRLVDEAEIVSEWRELAAAAGGLLVKSPTWLRNQFPERFEDTKAAENWAGRGGLPKPLNLQQDSYWRLRGFANHPAAVAFQPPATRRDRPRPVREAVFTGPPQDLPAAVEAYAPGATFTASLFGGLVFLTVGPCIVPSAPHPAAAPPAAPQPDCLTPPSETEDDSCP